jgi:tRNA G18 (ribose-2'-O)-methylase SpoU
MNAPRGFFGIGVEGISKEMNVGNLLRSAHSFGASFFFTVDSPLDMHKVGASDTADSSKHLPFYAFDKVSDVILPAQTSMVAVEFLPEAVDLPSFRHPLRAVYVLGREMGNVSDEMLARCDHVIKIPMKFCVNVGVAGALVMYDRLISMGGFPDRPVKAGGPVDFAPLQVKPNNRIR